MRGRDGSVTLSFSDGTLQTVSRSSLNVKVARDVHFVQ